MPHSKKVQKLVPEAKKGWKCFGFVAGMGCLAAVSSQGLEGRCCARPRTVKGGPLMGVYQGVCATGAGRALEQALVRGATGAAVNEEVRAPSSAARPL